MNRAERRRRIVEGRARVARAMRAVVDRASASALLALVLLAVTGCPAFLSDDFRLSSDAASSPNDAHGSDSDGGRPSDDATAGEVDALSDGPTSPMNVQDAGGSDGPDVQEPDAAPAPDAAPDAGPIPCPGPCTNTCDTDLGAKPGCTQNGTCGCCLDGICIES